MALFRRSVPGEARGLVSLARGERILLASATPAGWLVATTHALWLPEGASLIRVGWEFVDNAVWDRDSSSLQVHQTAELGGRPRLWNLGMDDDRDLLLVIKERVRATVITSRRVPVDGARGFTIVARRPPGQDAVTWTVAVDAGLDLDEATLRASVDQALGEMRAELGQ